MRLEFTVLEIMEIVKEAYDEAWEKTTKQIPANDTKLKDFVSNRHVNSYMQLYKGIQERFEQAYNVEE